MGVVTVSFFSSISENVLPQHGNMLLDNLLCFLRGGSIFDSLLLCSYSTCILFTELLEEALVGNDSEGPLCELLFFFLTAIFQAMAEEEEEVAKDQIADAETKGQILNLILN